VVAFVKGWRLALVLLACLPCVVIVGGFMSMLMAKMSTRGQAAYTEAGNIVDQTVGAIRTVRHLNQLHQIIRTVKNKSKNETEILNKFSS
jgi:ATP-binding cassette subfamily B (MDR/TAP) protein 1